MTYALVLDTMIYLHYQPIEQIDWQGVLGVPSSAEILVVVLGITLRELDKHKNQSLRLRDRARRASDRLSRGLAAGAEEIRPGVRLRGALRPPSMEFAALGLDPSLNDDVFVASALSFQQANPDMDIVVVTQDAYPSMRARECGLAVLGLDDVFKLPEEEDTIEKENKQLKRDLQLLQAARPVIDLQLATGGKTLRVVISELAPLSGDEVTEFVRDAERRYPSADSFRPASSVITSSDESQPPVAEPRTLREVREAAKLGDATAKQFLEGMVRALDSHVDEGELARYTKEREAFLRDYAAFQLERRTFERARRRRFALELLLVNTGTTPATDIDLLLHVPDGVVVTDEREPEEPRAPSPPRMPRKGPSLFSGLSPYFGGLDISRLPAPSLAQGYKVGPRNVSGLSIEQTGSYDVRCHVSRVKHGIPEAIPTLYIAVPDAALVRPFQIIYTLHAANVTKPVSDTLNMVLISS